MPSSQPNASRQKIPTQFDVIVVGAGAAGLYAALCLPESLQVCIITKDALKIGASDWAQGGIAAALENTDSAALHFEDTMRAGAGLCIPEAVQFLVEEAPERIESLLQLGVSFDRLDEQLAMTREAAHSRPRVLHAADTTGRAIINTLTAQVLERKNIQVLSQALALNLWLHPQTGHCQGISLLHHHQISWVRASGVVLATGGGGQVFAQTTNPAVSTGDGVALAGRAGALLRDLEFFQFHPTALTILGAPRFLISEAVRGEGAHLVDEQGDRFAFDYHPEGELAPRDVVSRAIFSHLQKNTPHPAHAHVYLDLRPINPNKIRQQFPNIVHVCHTWGIDVFREPVPVAPAAHYWMGGVVTDLNSRTSIPGLYAVGETASTGVHGANRLASNSLLECLVFGAQLADIDIEPNSVSRESQPLMQQQADAVVEDWEAEWEKLAWIRQQLPALVWDSAGICRTQAVLEKAIAQINSWRSECANFRVSQYLLSSPPCHNVKVDTPPSGQPLRTYAETLNLLDVAYLVLNSAAFRTESRGGHYRTDYPQTSPSWQVHTLVQRDHWWTDG